MAHSSEISCMVKLTESGTIKVVQKYAVSFIYYYVYLFIDGSNIDNWRKLQVLEEQESTESKYVIKIRPIFPPL